MSEEITAVINTPTSTPSLSLEDLKPKMKLAGKVEKLELYGAFINVGVSVNALIHISQLGEGHVNRVSDVLHEGDQVTVWIDKIDPAHNQIMVTMVEPLAVDWGDLKAGQVYTGTVARLENFGAFINIGAEREGLVHISELSHDYVKHPSEVVNIGDDVQVQVLGFSKRKRRIDLSMKALMEKPEPTPPPMPILPPAPPNNKSRRHQKPQAVEEEMEYTEEEEVIPTAMELALRRAMGDDTIDRIAATDKAKRGSRRARRKNPSRRQQDELLSRTLQMQD